MTYCLAVALNAGLVLASDTRTHAGVDQINSYHKMHRYVWPGDRMFCVLSAGNLATTQAVAKQLTDDAESIGYNGQSLLSVKDLAEAADYLGRVNNAVMSRHEGMVQQNILESTFILAGQIKGQEPGLYLIYPQGNYISVSSENPFFQIGETKYGKPILDRIIEPEMSLEDAARCAILSLDSTIRSNLSVGAPLDLLIYQRDALDGGRHLCLSEDMPLFDDIRKQWSEGLRQIFFQMPRFEWEDNMSSPAGEAAAVNEVTEPAVESLVAEDTNQVVSMDPFPESSNGPF